MVAVKNRKKTSSQIPNRSRHESGCRICAHPDREEIEQEFVAWKSPEKIAANFKLRDRSSIYRHAHALDLFSKRGRNLHTALGRIIEKVDDVQVNANAIVQAIGTYAKLISQGQVEDCSEQIILNDLFMRMTPEELKEYSEHGTLPDWFSDAISSKHPDSQEDH